MRSVKHTDASSPSMRNVVSYRVHPREWFGRGSDRYRTQLDGNSIVYSIGRIVVNNILTGPRVCWYLMACLGLIGRAGH